MLSINGAHTIRSWVGLTVFSLQSMISDFQIKICHTRDQFSALPQSILNDFLETQPHISTLFTTEPNDALQRLTHSLLLARLNFFLKNMLLESNSN